MIKPKEYGINLIIYTYRLYYTNEKLNRQIQRSHRSQDIPCQEELIRDEICINLYSSFQKADFRCILLFIVSMHDIK